MFSLVKQNKTKPKGQLSVDDALSVNTVNVKTNEQEKRRRRRRKKKAQKRRRKKLYHRVIQSESRTVYTITYWKFRGVLSLTEDNLDTGRRWSR